VINKLKEDPSVSGKFEWIFQENWKCDWEDNLARLDTCDVYVESQAYTIQNRAGETLELGEFGVTAMEAASLSKAVITCFKSFEDYKEEFGCTSELIPSGSEEELEMRLRNVLNMSPEQLIEKRLATRRWLVENHSREATGMRLMKLMNLKV
jgi:hypothetical protein